MGYTAQTAKLGRFVPCTPLRKSLLRIIPSL